MIYAGIGARLTPPHIITMMREISSFATRNGIVLRSGNALGADRAFEDMVVNPDLKEIFTAQSGTPEQREKWMDVACRFHPAWDRCTEYAKTLHARNTPIILGADLLTPVDFVVCWTPRGEITGGTGQSIRVADHYEIPVYNLFRESAVTMLRMWTGQ